MPSFRIPTDGQVVLLGANVLGPDTLLHPKDGLVSRILSYDRHVRANSVSNRSLNVRPHVIEGRQLHLAFRHP